MAGASQEYVVRAPNENSKRFNVMRFANSVNVDVTKWKVARMERERTVKQSDKTATEEAPKFGFGSEYGKDAKEEARRKRWGQYARKVDDCPWTLRVGGKNGKKFKGTREGGVTENTSYYVFFQAHDGAFEAFPVSEWYNFKAIPQYTPLTSEEAEERYEERHKIFNHFAVMAARKNNEGGETEQTETKLLKNMKKSKDFKVSDMDDWVDSDRSGDGDSDEGGDDGDTKKNGKGKGAKGAGKKKGGKKKKKGSDDDDSEPGEESDEGDHEAREVDYMSDSESDSDDEDLEEKLNKELKGVEDEDALRKLSDEEDDEEEGKAKEDAATTDKGNSEDVPKGNESEGKVKVKQEKGSDSDTSASDDSDDSDLDDSKFTSAMFLQKKLGSASKNKNGSDQKPSATPMASSSDQSGQSKSSNNGNNNGSNSENGNGSGSGASEVDSKSAVKRKFPATENSPIISKKPKTNDAGGEAISEEAVRRYLMRKPMTAAELLQKFKGRKVPLKGQDLVQTIAHILKKLNPDKQTIKGKLHLYIKPPAGS